jgi:hypothetical protein
MRGRPPGSESERRRRHFAELVAGDVPLRDAAKRARLNPWRALGLLDDESFLALVDLLQEGER